MQKILQTLFFSLMNRQSFDYFGQSFDYLGQSFDYLGQSFDYVYQSFEFLSNLFLMNKTYIKNIAKNDVRSFLTFIRNPYHYDKTLNYPILINTISNSYHSDKCDLSL